MKSQDMKPIWVRASRVPELADCGLTKAYDLINSGKLVSRKVGGMRLVLVASIEALGTEPKPEAAPAGPLA